MGALRLGAGSTYGTRRCRSGSRILTEGGRGKREAEAGNKAKGPSWQLSRHDEPFTTFPASRFPLLIDLRLNDRRERCACAVQARLHRAKIALGDLGDLFVRLPLELAKHEHLPMMLRQP